MAKIIARERERHADDDYAHKADRECLTFPHRQAPLDVLCPVIGIPQLGLNARLIQRRRVGRPVLYSRTQPGDVLCMLKT